MLKPKIKTTISLIAAAIAASSAAAQAELLFTEILRRLAGGQ